VTAVATATEPSGMTTRRTRGVIYRLIGLRARGLYLRRLRSVAPGVQSVLS
jgi:hypothetical protein